MSITQADVDALDRAMADSRGAGQITTTDGQVVVFQSVKDRLELRAWMVRVIAEAAGTSSNYRLAVVKKGT